MKESHGLLAYLAVHRQEMIYELVDHRMDGNASAAAYATEDFWEKVTVSLAAVFARLLFGMNSPR